MGVRDAVGLERLVPKVCAVLPGELVTGRLRPIGAGVDARSRWPSDDSAAGEVAVAVEVTQLGLGGLAEVGAALHQLADPLAQSGGGDAVETFNQFVSVGAAGGHGEVPAGGGQQGEGEAEARGEEGAREDEDGGEERGQEEEHHEAADSSHCERGLTAGGSGALISEI